MNSRQRTLLASTAEDLSNGVAPLGGDFLRRHDVTADESFDLADQLQLAINVYLVIIEAAHQSDGWAGAILAAAAVKSINQDEASG